MGLCWLIFWFVCFSVGIFFNGCFPWDGVSSIGSGSSGSSERWPSCWIVDGALLGLVFVCFCGGGLVVLGIVPL